MHSAAVVIALVWLLWGVMNVALSAWLQRNAGRLGFYAYCVGVFRPQIVVTKVAREKLNDDEFEAIYFHELGHIRCGHLWKNFALLMVFPFYRSKRRYMSQELEADNWATECGYGLALASALRKLSNVPFDLCRANILQQACGMQAPRVAGCDDVAMKEMAK